MEIVGDNSFDDDNFGDDFDNTGEDIQVQAINIPIKQFGPMRAKMKIAKLGVPSLDFTNLKSVKEYKEGQILGFKYKDWFGYSKKLESAISLLREKIDGLENQQDLNVLKKMKDDQTI